MKVHLKKFIWQNFKEMPISKREVYLSLKHHQIKMCLLALGRVACPIPVASLLSWVHWVQSMLRQEKRPLCICFYLTRIFAVSLFKWKAACPILGVSGILLDEVLVQEAQCEHFSFRTLCCFGSEGKNASSCDSHVSVSFEMLTALIITMEPHST